MREELSRGSWEGGHTALFIKKNSDGEISYEIESQYVDSVEKRDPPAVDFSPPELRELIRETCEKLGTNPFESGDFSSFVSWYDENGDSVIAEVEKAGVRKQFRVKRNDDNGTVYLKVQRWKDGSNLRDSPTLGRDEFEGVFGALVLL